MSRFHARDDLAASAARSPRAAMTRAACARAAATCAAVTFAAMLACAWGCSNDTSTGELKNMLIYGRGGESQGLDPIHVDVGESVKVVVNIFDTLIAYHDETVEIVPSLATSWETSKDGLLWTFHLRDGVRFHDGTEFNADAVKFSIDRLIDPNSPHVFDRNRIPYQQDYAMIREVRVVDPRTVEFELKQPNAVFLANMAMFSASIVSPEAVKSSKKDFMERPVGTGPFRMERWLRDQELVLSANPDYWRGPPGVEKVVFVPVKESAVRIAQLERGEIHIADDLPPVEVDQLVDAPGLKVQETQGFNLAYLTMQNDKPPLNQVKVRQAIWHAIDKARLIDLAYGGHAQPAINPMPRSMWAWHDGIQDRKFDPALAKSLLEEASQEWGFSLPLKLQLFVMASPRPYMQQPQETAVFIQESLKAVGIEVSIVVSDINQHFQRLSAGEHELGLAGWSSDNLDPDNFLYSLLDLDNINETGGNNASHYRGQEVHELLLNAKREVNTEKRKELYRQAQEKIFADAPMVPLVHTDVRIVQREEIEGYVLHPTALVRLWKARIRNTRPAAP